jgi:signal recognition particle subunit SRP54
MRQMKKLGPLSGILKMLPGMNQYSSLLEGQDTEGAMKKTEAIILSMTPAERRDPSMLRSSHKNRIAKGSGTTVQDVNRLLNNFDRMKRMMNQLGGNFRF